LDLQSEEKAARLLAMFRVVITDCLPEPASIERQCLDGLATVECWEARSNGDVVGRLSEVDAVILYHEVSMTRELIEEMNQCRVIARGGVGYDNIDLAAAAERGIIVTNVPDYGVDEVADHAIGLMLALRRGLCASQMRLKPSLAPWDRCAVEPLQRLAGQTFGVIGCGRIGTAAALRAKAFRMDVVFYDPFLAPGMEKALGLRRVSRLEDLLAQSDVVSIHAPLTDCTRRMIDASALAAMRKHAVLINTARGAIVDTAAVAIAIQYRHLAGAGIDVLPEEPATDDDALVRLWRSNEACAEHVILTPHTAYYSEQALKEIRQTSADEVRRVLAGERPRHPVIR
jgi:C-terminal binding protein